MQHLPQPNLANPTSLFDSALIARHAAHYSAFVSQSWDIECYRADGTLRWSDRFVNLVPNAGLDKYLDATFVTGLAVPAWYVGLKATGSTSALDTMGSHAGWLENTDYSNLARPTWTAGMISTGSVDNTASKAQFNISVASTTVYGAFLTNSNLKGGSVGVLQGVGDFATARTALNGDTLNVAVTMTMQTSGSI